MRPRRERRRSSNYIYRKIELPTSVVLHKIERNGVLIDADAARTCSRHELGARIMELEQQAYELAGGPFNLGSPKQIGEIFFGKLQLPVIKKTPTGAPSTDEEVLQKLAEDYPLPKILLEYRGMSKLKSTYTDKLPTHGQPRHRPRAHQLCAGGRGDGPPGVERPESAEHPDPHRRRAPHPRSVHRRRRAT